MNAVCSCQCCRRVKNAVLLSLWGDDTRLQLWLACLLLALMPSLMAPAIRMLCHLNSVSAIAPVAMLSFSARRPRLLLASRQLQVHSPLEHGYSVSHAMYSGWWKWEKTHMVTNTPLYHAAGRALPLLQGNVKGCHLPVRNTSKHRRCCALPHESAPQRPLEALVHSCSSSLEEAPRCLRMSRLTSCCRCLKTRSLSLSWSCQSLWSCLQQAGYTLNNGLTRWWICMHKYRQTRRSGIA